MRVEFSKMHSLGNDFMVVEAIQQALPDALWEPLMIGQLANRKHGIGFDQLLLLQKSENESADFRYRIFNADGSEVGQCGNGARCAHAFLQRRGLSTQEKIKLQTSTVTLETQMIDATQIRLSIPLVRYLDDVEMDGYHFQCVDIGNPHAICFSATIPAKSEIERMGAKINREIAGGMNVSFVTALSTDSIQAVVYERGVGLTDACGTAAMATAFIAHRNQSCTLPVSIHQPGGTLLCGVSADDYGWLQGDAVHVFDGQIEI